MGYQALLFCPDEKTARTVTQVLSELEFAVESCIEPFAAVKKLMGQHFDAVVVDCDNEQNATLLFKSARNSTSNQASLAVAVVEGQAGVAKAFRIGANLVLTKPINIEQAKGTLRVARGLLRKGEPAKPASAAPAVPPVKPVAAKPVPPLKTAAPVTQAPAAPAPVVPAAVSAPLPVAPPEVKPAAPQAWPAVAAASTVPTTNDDDLLDIGSGAPAAPSVANNALSKVTAFDSSGVKLPTPAASAAFSKALPATHGSGAASAPAPAREIHDAPVAALPASTPADDDILSDEPAKAAPSQSSSYAGSAPSFTFGGANTPEKSSGASKKILFGVAAAAFVAGAIYIGSTVYHGRVIQPESAPSQTVPVPVPVPPVAKPSGGKPAPVTTSAAPTTPAPAPVTSASVPSSQPAAVPAKSAVVNNADTASNDDAPSSAAGKPAAAPLVLKGGSAPVLHANNAAADAPAPSMIGIATAGTSAPPPNIVGAGSAPTPVLQTLNVSQGVSQGLLTKKIQPIYPRNALSMHIEGSVEVIATISKTGDISHVKVLSGDGQLAKAATDAVKQWKYKPYLLNGDPVEIQTQITINFKLPK
jgi:periplasmic protein TonB